MTCLCFFHLTINTWRLLQICSPTGQLESSRLEAGAGGAHSEKRVCCPCKPDPTLLGECSHRPTGCSSLRTEPLPLGWSVRKSSLGGGDPTEKTQGPCRGLSPLGTYRELQAGGGNCLGTAAPSIPNLCPKLSVPPRERRPQAHRLRQPPLSQLSGFSSKDS